MKRRILQAAVAAVLLALPAPVAVTAQTPATHTSVVVDSNPALFATLAALKAAGYNSVLPANDALGRELATQLDHLQTPALTELKAYLGAHRAATPNQDVAQYVTLALFLGNPPGLALTVPSAGLPPDAAGVADVVPILQRLWQQASLDQIWQQQQPAISNEISDDSTLVRAMLTQVDSYFRIPQAYGARQFYVYPSPLLASGQAYALNYEDNYYIVAGADLPSQMNQVRHTYLHFLLDPLIDHYPAAFVSLEHDILPLVAHAPALDLQFKRDPELLYTECLVRAVEIQLDPGTPEQKQASVTAAMDQGLVVTQRWYDKLTAFNSDPANFNEYYPEAAFALRLQDLPGDVKHLTFSPAPAVAPAQASVQPLRAPSLIEQAQARFDARDWATSTSLAQAALRQPRADQAASYYLLGKLAAVQNQPQQALNNFTQALATATPTDAHVRTWSNIYLARLYDAAHDRTHAIACYRAALSTADTPASKALAESGIKAPYAPSHP